MRGLLGLIHIVGLSIILLVIGLYGLASKRNIVRMLISIEILINASLVNIIAFSSYYGSAPGLLIGLVGIAVAAAETTVGLAIALLIKRRFGTIDVTKVSELRG